MKTFVIVGSLLLAAVPALAQQSASTVKRTLPAAASHATLPPKPAAPAKTATPSDAKTVATTPAVTAPAAAAAAPPARAAEKPAAPKKSTSAESAAERILRRLDEAFPAKGPGEKAAVSKTPVKAPVAKTSPARHAVETPIAPRASNHVTLNWRIALRWPDEIAPAHQVK